VDSSPGAGNRPAADQGCSCSLWWASGIGRLRHQGRVGPQSPPPPNTPGSAPWGGFRARRGGSRPARRLASIVLPLRAAAPAAGVFPAAAEFFFFVQGPASVLLPPDIGELRRRQSLEMAGGEGNNWPGAGPQQTPPLNQRSGRPRPVRSLDQQRFGPHWQRAPQGRGRRCACRQGPGRSPAHAAGRLPSGQFAGNSRRPSRRSGASWPLARARPSAIGRSKAPSLRSFPLLAPGLTITPGCQGHPKPLFAQGGPEPRSRIPGRGYRPAPPPEPADVGRCPLPPVTRRLPSAGREALLQRANIEQQPGGLHRFPPLSISPPAPVAIPLYPAPSDQAVKQHEFLDASLRGEIPWRSGLCRRFAAWPSGM